MAQSPLDYRRDVYSQSGEDGVIEALLSRVGERDRWCVEFGAWDGTHFSNTRNLIDASGYHAVLIEGNPTRFITLEKYCRGTTGATAINAIVGFGEDDSLDVILSKTSVPRDFDFLSIDIDGNDYHAWNAIQHYQPKVVCIEFNPSIPTDCDFVQAADPSVFQGSSILALTKLGKQKGYELACVLSFNAFFVRADLFPRLGIEDNAPATLRTDLSFITHFFHGFDGTIFIRGNTKLLWHGVPLKEAKFQVLPAMLRRHWESYGRLKRKLLQFYQK
jgi:hypothetical protein